MEWRVVFRCCLDFLFVAVIDTMTESHWQERVYYSTQLWSIMEGSQGRTLEAGT